MTAINFPDSPNNGDTFVNGDVTYTWDGVKWTAKGSEIPHVKKAGDTMTGNLTVPSINTGPLAGMRNRIINGGMEITQRGDSADGAVTSTQYIGPDRWRTVVPGGNWTVKRALNHPGGGAWSYFIGNTSNFSPTAAQTVAIDHGIEGFNLAGLKDGQKLTLSFWVASSVAGTYVAELYKANGQTAGVSYTHSGSGWEYKELEFAMDTSGVSYNGTRQLTVNFFLSVGSNFTSGTFTPGAWTTTTGNRAPAGHASFGSTAGSQLWITDVQLEPGPVATPFECRPYGTELLLCQRYYSKGSIRWSGQINSGSAYQAYRPLPTQMRAVPAATFTASGQGSFGTARTQNAVTEEDIGVSATASSTGSGYFFTSFTADAEL